MLHKLLLDPDPSLLGGGGGTPSPGSWTDTLPPELKSSASLTKFKDVGELARGYVNAESLIGQKRLAAPTEKWGENEWNTFYKELGRPEKPDDYKLGDDVKFPEGMSLDATKLAKANAALHKAGLTVKQHAEVMKYYASTLGETVAAETDRQRNAVTEGTNKLKGDWGAKFDANLDIARSAIKKFGTPELIAELESSGFANNPAFIKALHAIGAAIMEDSTHGRGGGGLEIMDSTRALTEIDALKMDKEFQAALTDGRSPGHKAAVDRWMDLHTKAHAKKSE